MTKPPKTAARNAANIYIGIGGWTFAPWRGVFYPEKLTQAKELEYAASKLTSIEINGTYYGSQKPESFRKWAREVPDGFVFSLKGPRFATNRRVLAEAGDFVKRFYRFRRAGARRPARSGAVAVRADQEVRRGRFRQISRAAAAQARGPRAAPCGRGAPRQFCRAGIHRAAAQIRNACRVRRARQISGDRRRRRRFRLCAAAEGQ